MYENGSREPDYETLEAIADYFNVDIDYLLGRTNKTTRLINPNTLAAHFDDAEYTIDELEEIKQFAAFVKSKRKPSHNSNEPLLNAAHARTDIEVTADDQKFDDDIMDDDNF